jgi:hypothetical protein
MEAMLSGIVLLVLFASTVALLPFAYAGWRRLTAREGDLQIWHALRRSGLSSHDTAGHDAKLANAVRRCVMCRSIDECDHWLASHSREGLEHFCPNASFFAELKSGKPQATEH